VKKQAAFILVLITHQKKQKKSFQKIKIISGASLLQPQPLMNNKPPKKVNLATCKK
jgi:hypothetical protein